MQARQGRDMRPVGSAGGAVFDCFGGDRVWMSMARTATSPTMMTNKLAAPKQRNKNATTNQKHVGLTGERRDMRHNRRGAWWERELIVLGRSSWDRVRN